MPGFIIFLFSVLIAVTPLSSTPSQQTPQTKVAGAIISVTLAPAATATPTLIPTNTPKPTAIPTLKPMITLTPKVIVWPTFTPTPTPTPYVYQQPAANDLSNNSYYTNSAGNTVHAPAYTTDNAVPAGATAKCGDGTYSFSQSRSGTCSHHGGVAQWL